MNARTWKKLAETHLLPHLPGFVVVGRWLVAAPVGWQARGFLLEPSGFNQHQFTIEVCVWPLYVPQSPGLTFGERLGWIPRGGREIWWDVEAQDPATVCADILRRMQRDGLPYLAQRGTVQAMTTLRHRTHSDMRYVHQALMLAGALLDDARVVARQWALLSEHRRPHGQHDRQPWEIELERVTEAAHRRFGQDPDGLRAEIATWREARAAEAGLTAQLAVTPEDLVGLPRRGWFG